MMRRIATPIMEAITQVRRRIVPTLEAFTQTVRMSNGQRRDPRANETTEDDLESISTIYPENEGGSDSSDNDNDDNTDNGTAWTFDRDMVEEAEDDDDPVTSNDTLRDEHTVDEEYNSDGEGTVDDDDTDDGSSRHDTRYEATISEYKGRPSWRDSDEEDEEYDSD
jgi:hypothetical protein